MATLTIAGTKFRPSFYAALIAFPHERVEASNGSTVVTYRKDAVTDAQLKALKKAVAATNSFIR